MSMRTSRRIRTIPAIAAILLGAGAAAPAQQGARDGEWRYYGGDSGSTKYSPLDQIDRGNVRRPRHRVAVAVGQLRPPSRLQLPGDAVGGRGRALHLGGLAAQRRGHRRGHRRDAVDVPPRRGRPRRRRAGAGQLGPGGGVLDGRRGRRADHPRHPGLSPRGPGRRDRIPDSRLRRPGRRRPLRRDLRRARPPGGGERPDRPELARPRRRRRHRGGGGAARPPPPRPSSRPGSCAGSTCAPASGYGSSTPSPSRASSATTRGRTTRGATAGTPAYGPRCRPTRSSATCTCPSRPPPTTSTAAIGPATTCSRRAWCVWTRGPASASGTSSSSITASGTTTSPPRPRWSTSPSTAGGSRRWRR